ncbi:MAG: hypothetical protein EPN21_12930 [Methylococcaceae bacterium]|nr:MAG: hypothetical protein EPN21_12930 [Methylococcaceae bacterium]
MTAARSFDDNFFAYSVQISTADALIDPQAVALTDEICLTDIELGQQGKKMAKSMSVHVIADAKDQFVDNLQLAFAAPAFNCTHTYDSQTRLFTLHPKDGPVKDSTLIRLLSTLYKQQAIVFKDLVSISNKFGVSPPPTSFDTIKRDLTYLWSNPNPTVDKPHVFHAPYFKFNPSFRIARGPALVDRIELDLERATRHSPCVTLHISPKATEVFVANLQAALDAMEGIRHHYNKDTHNLTVVPSNQAILASQMSEILDILYTAKAVAYNDQIDACTALGLTPPEENPAKSKERRDLEGLCKDLGKALPRGFIKS